MPGADPELRQTAAAFPLHWEAINYTVTVAERYDFEGSIIQPIENTFRGFGARQRPYFLITRRPP